MPDFVHNNIRLHYETEGDGIPFIFLHGLGGDLEQIRNLYQPVEGVRLILPDQQGHGTSEVNWSAYHFQTLADDVIALADHLKIDKFYLAGISMGAAVSINIAVRYPERLRGLLLIRNAWTDKPMGAGIQELFRECARCLKDRSISDFRKTGAYSLIFALSDYTAKTFCRYFEEDASLRNYQKFLILPGLAPIEASSDLSGVRVPVIILANHQDPVHPFAYGCYYQKHIAGAKLYEIVSKDEDESRHKAAVNRYILELLHLGTERQ